MMGPKMIMFLVFIFVIGNIFCMIIEGSFFGATDTTIMNALTGYSNLSMSDIGALPRLGIGFFTVGLPKVIMWDYSFLEGDWAIIKWVLFYPITAGVVYAIGMLIMNAVTGVLGRLR